MIKYEKILESNKLIAEFIGLTPHNILLDELQAPGEFSWMAVNVNINSNYAKEENEFTCFEEFFQFNKSWDWLIPVVEKIELLGYVVIIHSNNCCIENIGLFKRQEPCTYLADSYGLTKIEAVYIGIIEFITWYNQNKLN